MAEKIFASVSVLSTGDNMKCVSCDKSAAGQCTKCSAPLCKLCFPAHKKKHDDDRRIAIATLTQAKCIICGLPPDGECSYGTCRAPVCDHPIGRGEGKERETCRQVHERAHRDPRSDAEKLRCVICHYPPDSRCSICQDPLCHNVECFEKHNDKAHSDTKLKSEP